MKRGGDSLDLRLARAVAAHSQGRLKEAKMGYVAILQQDPNHLRALLQYAALQHENARYTDAVTIYQRVLELAPRESGVHVRLGHVFRDLNNLVHARRHYEAALAIDPENADAHQGMAYVFSGLHDAPATLYHGKKGYAGRAHYKLPFRGSGRPTNVLVLYSVLGGNIPLDRTIDNSVIQHIALTVEFHDPSAALPPHDLVFNAIGDVDQSASALDLVAEILKRSTAPVLNLPDRVLRTGRVENSRRFAGIKGLVAPRAASFPRATLLGPDAPAMLEAQGFSFPLLLRAQGYHTGEHFEKLDAPARLTGVAAAMPGENLMVIQFMDARNADREIRKYRVMMVDGRLYPLHAAISKNWKIHYFSADMRESAPHRAEDEAFLKDMPLVLGGKAMAVLAEVQAALGLDYAGIDFSLTASGDILLYETNATMIIARSGADPRWDYRREPVQKVLDAVNAMLKSRAKAAS